MRPVAGRCLSGPRGRASVTPTRAAIARGPTRGSVHARQDVGLGEVVLVPREADRGGPGPHVEAAEFSGPAARALRVLLGALLAIRLLRCHRALLMCRVTLGAYRTVCAPALDARSGLDGRPVRTRWRRFLCQSRPLSGGSPQDGRWVWVEPRAGVRRLQVNQMSGHPLDRECKQAVTDMLPTAPQYPLIWGLLKQAAHSDDAANHPCGLQRRTPLQVPLARRQARHGVLAPQRLSRGRADAWSCAVSRS